MLKPGVTLCVGSWFLNGGLVCFFERSLFFAISDVMSGCEVSLDVYCKGLLLEVDVREDLCRGERKKGEKKGKI